MNKKLLIEMKRRGISASTLAAQVGVSPSTISRLKNNGAGCSEDLARKICEVLPALSPGDLVPSFVTRLRAARIENGLTLEEVAKALGLSSSTLSRLERGCVSTTYPRAVEISRFFKGKVTSAQIMGGH